MGEIIKIQFICERCTARLVIECDESIWTFKHPCKECQAIRTFLRDVVICEDEPYEPIPISVYLFRADDRYKIGTSVDPERRLRDFSASPIPVELVWASQAQGAKEIERRFHKLFKEKRCHSEWFKLDDADIEYIKKMGAQHG